ncbi:hypothetical protein NPIL_300481 [Nephila pilipes]|uniref:Uncharacterized protein n=1 Tax=Nephila pilipes TaxID=299642 RepID=A0A8X6QPF8_NEPPI|nr:hypothetical protein NPIL_300481 [Nephila pilipes]
MREEQEGIAGITYRRLNPLSLRTEAVIPRLWLLLASSYFSVFEPTGPALIKETILNCVSGANDSSCIRCSFLITGARIISLGLRTSMEAFLMYLAGIVFYSDGGVGRSVKWF